MSRLVSIHFFPLAAALALCGCGGEEFGSDDTGSGGRAATSSGSESGGAGGGSSSSSGGGDGGRGGDSSSSTGGREGCRPGEYVDDGTARCRSCADFSDFEFDTPQALSLLGPGSSKSAARVQLVEGEPVMTYHYYDQSFDIGRAKPPYDVGEPFVEVNTEGQEAAPLLLPAGVAVPDLPSPGANAYIVFERPALNSTTLVARLLGGGLETVLPAPYNDGESDHSFAFAYAGSKAMFWVTKRMLSGNAYDGLITYNDLTTQMKAVDIQLPACAAAEVDAPWVTPDGDRLFFHAADCASGAPLLYWVPVGTDGLPVGPAAEIPGMAVDAMGAVAPSLSPDACDLFFTAILDLETFEFETRVAHRK